MAKVEQIITISFPCGYTLKVENRVSAIFGSVDVGEEDGLKYKLCTCPVHGNSCPKRSG